MFENPRRGRQAKNFTTNVSKILDLKSCSEQIFSKICRCQGPDDQLLNTFITKKPVTGSLVVFIREIFLYIFCELTGKGSSSNPYG